MVMFVKESGCSGSLLSVIAFLFLYVLPNSIQLEMLSTQSLLPSCSMPPTVQSQVSFYNGHPVSLPGASNGQWFFPDFASSLHFTSKDIFVPYLGSSQFYHFSCYSLFLFPVYQLYNSMEVSWACHSVSGSYLFLCSFPCLVNSPQPSLFCL